MFAYFSSHPVLGDVQDIGGGSVHRGDTMMSTSGNVQYIRAYNEYIGGYHKYVGGCSVHWGFQ